MSVTPEQLAEIKQMLLDEYKEAVDAIQKAITTIQVNQEANIQRVDKLEDLMFKHHVVCSQQKEDVGEVLELVRTMKAGMRVTNFMQGFFVKTVAVGTALYGLWQMLKDHLK